MPHTAPATALIAGLTAAVAAAETHIRTRGAGRRQALEEAVGAVIGGVLRAALPHGRTVSHSRGEGAYRGHIGHAAAHAALDGLAALGFLRHYPGGRFEAPGFGRKAVWTGYVSRYEATEGLISLAAVHGITADSVRHAFTTRYPVKPEVIKNLVEIKRFSEDGGQAIPVRPRDATRKRLTDDVRRGNALLRQCSWSSDCQPPALYRAFRGDWTHGGRWIVAGEAPIQQMAGAARVAILIDGQPTIEIDARGSQLSILAALAGVEDLGADPYQMSALAMFPRAVVKDAVTFTLGSGKLRRRWPKDAGHGVSMAGVTAALVSVHPYVANLAGLLNVSPGHVALRLQNIEAGCLTATMRILWNAGVACVPIHDSVLVKASAADLADAALREGYHAVTGAIIQTKRTARTGEATSPLR